MEPYVVAADIYRLLRRSGRGGWTWYTGPAGWMYRAWIEEIHLAVQLLVVAEDDPQDLGQGEDELPVRQPQLKGRKYSSPQSGLVHLILAIPLREYPQARNRSTALVIRSRRNFPSRLANSSS